MNGVSSYIIGQCLFRFGFSFALSFRNDFKRMFNLFLGNFSGSHFDPDEFILPHEDLKFADEEVSILKRSHQQKCRKL